MGKSNRTQDKPAMQNENELKIVTNDLFSVNLYSMKFLSGSCDSHNY